MTGIEPILQNRALHVVKYASGVLEVLDRGYLGLHAMFFRIFVSNLDYPVYSNAEDPGGNFGENRICTMMGISRTPFSDSSIYS